jgi:mRNA-degrading endonuclease YafQ of YafQ-DinJ toxin-antitoxin module
MLLVFQIVYVYEYKYVYVYVYEYVYRLRCVRVRIQAADLGVRDHALKGRWQGYRAIRLSDAYRAIYIVRANGSIETVYVEEVNKHDY